MSQHHRDLWAAKIMVFVAVCLAQYAGWINFPWWLMLLPLYYDLVYVIISTGLIMAMYGLGLFFYLLSVLLMRPASEALTHMSEGAWWTGVRTHDLAQAEFNKMVVEETATKAEVKKTETPQEKSNAEGNKTQD